MGVGTGLSALLPSGFRQLAGAPALTSLAQHALAEIKPFLHVRLRLARAMISSRSSANSVRICDPPSRDLKKRCAMYIAATAGGNMAMNGTNGPMKAIQGMGG